MNRLRFNAPNFTLFFFKSAYIFTRGLHVSSLLQLFLVAVNSKIASVNGTYLLSDWFVLWWLISTAFIFEAVSFFYPSHVLYVTYFIQTVPDSSDVLLWADGGTANHHPWRVLARSRGQGTVVCLLEQKPYFSPHLLWKLFLFPFAVSFHLVFSFTDLYMHFTPLHIFSVFTFLSHSSLDLVPFVIFFSLVTSSNISVSVG